MPRGDDAPNEFSYLNLQSGDPAPGFVQRIDQHAEYPSHLLAGRYIIPICIVATLAGFLFGYDTGVISGAIMSHLTVLGIDVQGDGGLLFGLAVVVFLASLVVLYLHRREIPVIGDRL